MKKRHALGLFALIIITATSACTVDRVVQSKWVPSQLPITLSGTTIDDVCSTFQVEAFSEESKHIAGFILLENTSNTVKQFKLFKSVLLHFQVTNSRGQSM